MKYKIAEVAENEKWFIASNPATIEDYSTINLEIVCLECILFKF